MFKNDLKRIEGKNNYKKILENPEIQYIYIYRKYNSCKNRIIKKILYYFYRIYSFLFGFQISLECKIGKGLNINHWGSIVINPGVELGENINLHPGITIGQENRGKRKGAPIIGNSVWIGANVVIVGKINIGNNVLISPNTFINFDVPDNSIVIGNPGKIIKSENATEGYINRKV
ncbi:serine O-acetyltransferase [Cetobacterium ceti]|uniref:Serine acetyltransferase n=1 Tax=Cetobacterium ceti TaxID=180163 RepID=A0A1T4LWD9_9FUSO|nr:hypothetical protein [Cetobacterium ceti]SJZ58956.1 serine O-acetyltransferase [Cetobacterium ceti]